MMKNILFAFLFFLSNGLFAQQHKLIKKTNAYDYQKTNNHYTDSCWLSSSTIITRQGNPIMTITYSPNGDVRQITVREIDTPSKKTVAYRVFNSTGTLKKERLKEHDDKGNVIIPFVYNTFDIKVECQKKDPCITCEYNKQGDIIYFEQRAPKDKALVLEKYRYEYEYWEE